MCHLLVIWQFLTEEKLVQEVASQQCLACQKKLKVVNH